MNGISSKKKITGPLKTEPGYERIADEIKKKNPGLAKAAERSPLKSIRLFCLECMGGNRATVRKCTTTACPLHRFRMGVGVNSRLSREVNGDVLGEDELGDELEEGLEGEFEEEFEEGGDTTPVLAPLGSPPKLPPPASREG